MGDSFAGMDPQLYLWRMIHPLRPVTTYTRMIECSCGVLLGDSVTIEKKKAYPRFEHSRPTDVLSRFTMSNSLVHLKTLDGLKRKRKSRLDYGRIRRVKVG